MSLNLCTCVHGVSECNIMSNSICEHSMVLGGVCWLLDRCVCVHWAGALSESLCKGAGVGTLAPAVTIVDVVGLIGVTAGVATIAAAAQLELVHLLVVARLAATFREHAPPAGLLKALSADHCSGCPLSSRLSRWAMEKIAVRPSGPYRCITCVCAMSTLMTVPHASANKYGKQKTDPSSEAQMNGVGAS